MFALRSGVLSNCYGFWGVALFSYPDNDQKRVERFYPKSTKITRWGLQTNLNSYTKTHIRAFRDLKLNIAQVVPLDVQIRKTLNPISRRVEINHFREFNLSQTKIDHFDCSWALRKRAQFIPVAATRYCGISGYFLETVTRVTNRWGNGADGPISLLTRI